MLELVQNADDCSYDTGVAPTLAIFVFQDGLLFATNEQGFNERNVTAICDLGNSSKSRSLGAYTGEKGEPSFLRCGSWPYPFVKLICCDRSQGGLVSSAVTGVWPILSVARTVARYVALQLNSSHVRYAQ